MVFTIFIQVFIGYETKNSMVWGVHIGELAGQIAYAITRTEKNGEYL